ncbi:MAG: hypothetical protein NTY12_04360 [Candidatus Falkowbacteria bacterium]|nr:hypothetical protein [Candidatus Falkowbacteria bacterium]
MEHETPVVHHAGGSLKKKFDGKSNLIIALGAVVVILVVVAGINFGGGIFKFNKNLSPDQAKAKAEEFINKNLVQGTTASVTEVTDYSGSLYKLKVKVGTNEIDSYISKDGKEFFPQSMKIDDIAASTGTKTDTAATNTQTPVTPADIVKSDKPKVEVFVMSHCPYGTQIEKGIVPVMETLGNKADIQIKFVNYAMHGQVEVEDNIRQYCISKEQNDKYTKYLSCFLKAGDYKGCISSTGIDQGKLDSCFKATDSKYNLLKSFNDKSTWNGSFPPFSINEAENKAYGVQGSPTLVINGKQVEVGRDSANLLAAVCAGFNKKPAECDTKLASASPSAGFGEGTDTSGSAANCAPAN